MGDGSTKMLSVPIVANNFYRVRVGEFDTDGDGVSDWVEGVTSLNPNSQTTTVGVNDKDHVAAQLALPNTVTIKATAPFASEDGPQPGAADDYAHAKATALSVNYTPSGTALPNIDYATLSGTVSLASGVD